MKKTAYTWSVIIAILALFYNSGCAENIYPHVCTKGSILCGLRDLNQPDDVQKSYETFAVNSSLSVMGTASTTSEVFSPPIRIV